MRTAFFLASAFGWLWLAVDAWRGVHRPRFTAAVFALLAALSLVRL